MTGNVNDKHRKQKLENSEKTNNKKNWKAYRPRAWLIIKAY